MTPLDRPHSHSPFTLMFCCLPQEKVNTERCRFFQFNLSHLVVGRVCELEMAFERCSVRPFPTVVELATSLGAFVVERANASIASHGRFMLAVSGGSVLEVRDYQFTITRQGLKCVVATELSATIPLL